MSAATMTERPATVRTVLAGFRPWHPLLQRAGRFHWVLGLRVALCFVGPIAVSHLTGRWAAQTGVMALGAFLVSIFLAPFDRPRQQLGAGLALATVLPLTVLVSMAVGTGPGRVAALAVVGLVAGLSVGWPTLLGTYARSFGLALIISPELPGTAFAVRWVAAGGLLAVAVTLLTSRLTPDHLRSPGRPPVPDRTVVRHHAVRLALALGLAGAVAAAAGSSTPIREHSLWLGIGVWIVLQPYLHDTVAKAVQRGTGTVIGGLLTLALVQAVPAGFWVGWLFLVLAFLCFGIRPVNYGWYCVFLTPIIVMGFGPVTHDYAVLEARLGWTVAGSLLALAIRFALWPTHGHPGAGPARIDDEAPVALVD